MSDAYNNIIALFMRNHIYWIESSEHVLLSDLAQPLIGRINNNNLESQTLQKTMAENGASLASSYSSFANYRNLSQQSYYQQLGLLQRLSDASKTPVNVASFAPVADYDFDLYGGLGFNIDNSGDAFSVEFSTENGIADLIYLANSKLNSLSNMAMIGIISAIAIPAYQDYVERAQRLQKTK